MHTPQSVMICMLKGLEGMRMLKGLEGLRLATGTVHHVIQGGGYASDGAYMRALYRIMRA